jgi:hypothetical protein
VPASESLYPQNFALTSLTNGGRSVGIVKPQTKRSLGIPRQRWVHIVKVGLVEIGLSGVDWIGLV